MLRSGFPFPPFRHTLAADGGTQTQGTFLKSLAASSHPSLPHLHPCLGYDVSAMLKQADLGVEQMTIPLMGTERWGVGAA